jgi:4-diphosphocytidyl-2-C-methyl-D-erythritol kinase
MTIVIESSTKARAWRAPAKVNLTLHILGRREDGWHDLDSIVAFAGCGDVLSFTPGRSLALTIDGPTAEKAGATDDNLVLKAARLLQERVPGLRTGAFHLDKRLPVAAGLGGGSSDAAAALRALADENGLSRNDPRLGEAARACGADVLVCLDPRARVMTGVGDLLGPKLKIPMLHAVLVNPGAAVPTPAVFARMGLAKGQKNAGGPSPALPVGGDRRETIVAALRQGRNDMQEAALSIAPVIGDTLEALRHSGASLARMSGSGATCFALYEDRAASLQAARTMARAHPDWWIKATVLR